MPGFSKEDRELAEAARAKAGSVTALAAHFQVSIQTASGWGRRYAIPRHLRERVRAYVGTPAEAEERAAVDPASTAVGDGARERLKNQPDLLEHLARQTELLSLIPALRAEVEALRAEIATLRASSTGAAAPDLVALVRARFGPKTARAVARVLAGGGVRRANRNQGTSR